MGALVTFKGCNIILLSAIEALTSKDLDLASVGTEQPGFCGFERTPVESWSQ